MTIEILEYSAFFVPFMLITVILGYELAIYHLYHYFKNKDKNVGLNKTFLAYGLFFEFSVTGYLMRFFNLFFAFNEFLMEIFNKLTYVTILLAMEFALITISSEDFRDVINRKLARVLYTLMMIPFICVVIFPTNSIFYLLSTIPFGFGILFFLYFHLRLVRLSTGQIKTRLIIIYMGEIICFFSLLVGAEVTVELFQVYNVTFQFVSTILFFLGLLIIFLGVFRFPIFLEFNWKNVFRRLYVIDHDNLEILYTFDFKPPIDSIDTSTDEKFSVEQKEELFPRGISGIDDIISLITDTKGEKIEKIGQAESLILLEYGEAPFSFLTYVLLVEKEMSSSRYFLKTAKNEFQNTYKVFLIDYKLVSGDRAKIFSNFNLIINQLLK